MSNDTQHAVSQPRANGPYSQTVVAGPLVFCSGQLPVDPRTGKIESKDIRGQTQAALNNLRVALLAEGCRLGDVVKTTVFMQSLGDFAEMNAVFAEYSSDRPPTRSTIGGLSLPKGALVEIEAIALLGPPTTGNSEQYPA